MNGRAGRLAGRIKNAFMPRRHDNGPMPSVAKQPDPTRVPVLDLLRLAAVGAVILYHYGFWGPA